MSPSITLAFLTGLCTAALVAFCAPQDEPAGDDSQPEALRVPLLVVDRTGGTLLGPAHMHLLVYDDGHVAYVSRSGAPGDRHDLTRDVGPERARELRDALVQAGALSLTDQLTGATDMPLTTVTVLEPRPRGRAHTFSYWVPGDEFEPIEELLAGFVAEHLLGEGSNGPAEPR